MHALGETQSTMAAKKEVLIIYTNWMRPIIFEQSESPTKEHIPLRDAVKVTFLKK